ncbi:MAG TPA: hypothetical protein VES03_06340 [Motilibacterales bacterium]|nr:hypothetical protein [Motilibacterales bacterium]
MRTLCHTVLGFSEIRLGAGREVRSPLDPAPDPGAVPAVPAGRH